MKRYSSRLGQTKHRGCGDTLARRASWWLVGMPASRLPDAPARACAGAVEGVFRATSRVGAVDAVTFLPSSRSVSCGRALRSTRTVWSTKQSAWRRALIDLSQVRVQHFLHIFLHLPHREFFHESLAGNTTGNGATMRLQASFMCKVAHGDEGTLPGFPSPIFALAHGI